LPTTEEQVRRLVQLKLDPADYPDRAAANVVLFAAERRAAAEEYRQERDEAAHRLEAIFEQAGIVRQEPAA
jgi:hypothetical protein